jgi:hypothetical protein
MKKKGVLALLFLIVIMSVLVSANNSTNASKIERGFSCLDGKVKDCTSLSVSEMAFTILSVPDKSFSSCVNELKKKKSNENWGNVKDTALAILALNHAGENTKASEEWLIKQSKIPTELTWYLQQDSTGEVECNIGYDGSDYTIRVGENKKIDRDAGSCLTRAQSNYWFAISSNCYDREFDVRCTQNFIANLLYKNRNSPTIYVIEGTKKASAYDSVKLKVNSKCFGDSSTCDYEASAWATYTLLKLGYDVQEYIPYVIAMSDSNKKFMPEPFIYLLTGNDESATRIISSKNQLVDFWEAEASAYGRFYDTALVHLAIGSSSSEQVKKSRDWLLFSQGSDGCWNNIRDTAIILWALERRQSKTAPPLKTCSSAGYFCIPISDCPSEQLASGDYHCSQGGFTCCKTENLKTCSEYLGKVCSSEQYCTGNIRKATDTQNCCTGECVEKTKENECEEARYSCQSQCFQGQEEIDYECDSNKVCCRTKTTQDPSSFWTWLIIILGLVALAIICYIYREKLKLLWFKFKTKYRRDKGGMPPRGPPGPPRGPPMMQRGPPGPPRGPPIYMSKPGFPPIRRMPAPPSPPRKIEKKDDKQMSDVFDKLKKMSG